MVATGPEAATTGTRMKETVFVIEPGSVIVVSAHVATHLTAVEIGMVETIEMTVVETVEIFVVYTKCETIVTIMSLRTIAKAVHVTMIEGTAGASHHVDHARTLFRKQRSSAYARSCSKRILSTSRFRKTRRIERNKWL